MRGEQVELRAGRGASLKPSAQPAPSALPVGSAPPPAAVSALAEESGPQPYDPKKAFGAIARIHLRTEELTPRQKARLEAFIRRYNARTARSKEFTQENRGPLADPRVVSGFKPAIRALAYPIGVNGSSGARLG